MNKKIMDLITTICEEIKSKTDEMSLDERLKRLMYTFIVVKGSPNPIMSTEASVDIYAMMYGISIEYARSVFKNNLEYAALHMLGLTDDVIKTELINFTNEYLIADKVLKEKVDEINGQ